MVHGNISEQRKLREVLETLETGGVVQQGGTVQAARHVQGLEAEGKK